MNCVESSFSMNDDEIPVFLVYERKPNGRRRLHHAWKTRERAEEQCEQLNREGQAEYYVDETKIIRIRRTPRSFIL